MQSAHDQLKAVVFHGCAQELEDLYRDKDLLKRKFREHVW